jgi:hypothetical protein
LSPPSADNYYGDFKISGAKPKNTRKSGQATKINRRMKTYRACVKRSHTMEINANKPVNNEVRGLDNIKKISPVKREKEDAPDLQASRTRENPDYRISLSDESKKAVSELAGTPASGRDMEAADISEEEAVQIARQASAQLSQTNASISNQAIQNAVDLFT